jgi:hypothetical protein
MRKIILIVAILVTGLMAFACPTCDIAQPRYLRGITHGTGPQTNWDFLIVSTIAVIVIATLFFSIKWLVQPGEKSLNHIKHLILNID